MVRRVEAMKRKVRQGGIVEQRINRGDYRRVEKVPKERE